MGSRVRLIKLPLREGTEDCTVGDGGDVETVGVFAPDDMRDSPTLAGVEGGGMEPDGPSLNVERGLGLSGMR